MLEVYIYDVSIILNLILGVIIVIPLWVYMAPVRNSTRLLARFIGYIIANSVFCLLVNLELFALYILIIYVSVTAVLFLFFAITDNRYQIADYQQVESFGLFSAYKQPYKNHDIHVSGQLRNLGGQTNSICETTPTLIVRIRNFVTIAFVCSFFIGTLMFLALIWSALLRNQLSMPILPDENELLYFSIIFSSCPAEVLIVGLLMLIVIIGIIAITRHPLTFAYTKIYSI